MTFKLTTPMWLVLLVLLAMLVLGIFYFLGAVSLIWLLSPLWIIGSIWASFGIVILLKLITKGLNNV